ncbi:MAG: hypothetical protein H0V81_17875 [Solirubrobacterales bacterium]|nr:hypothetical protein [Solirubrobacterales bacterium]
MTEHTFRLTLTADPEPHLDELFEAGCDDALFGAVDHVHYAEFDREGLTLADAVLSAISDLESVPSLQVRHVEPDDLVTIGEIADRLGRTRESVRLLVTGQRGPGSFPPPAARTTTRNRLWHWTDVQHWHDRDADTARDADTIAALNAALELRARTHTLDPGRRQQLNALAG